MNIYQQRLIEQKGIKQHTQRVDRYCVSDVYLFNGELRSILRFCPSDYAIQNTPQEKLETLKKSLEHSYSQIKERKLYKMALTPRKSLGIKKDNTAAAPQQMNLEGFAMAKEVRSLLNDLKAEIAAMKETLLDYGTTQKTCLQEIKGTVESKLNTDKQIIALLQTISETLNKSGCNCSPAAAKETPVSDEIPVSDETPVNDENLYDRFKRHGGTVEKAVFGKWLATLDQSSQKAMADSSNHRMENVKGYLYAPKNKARNIEALWTALHENKTGERITQGESSVVYNDKYFSSLLNIDIEHINEVITHVKTLEAFDDDTEAEVQEYLESYGMECKESDFQTFVQWLRDNF